MFSNFPSSRWFAISSYAVTAAISWFISTNLVLIVSSFFERSGIMLKSCSCFFRFRSRRPKWWNASWRGRTWRGNSEAGFVLNLLIYSCAERLGAPGKFQSLRCRPSFKELWCRKSSRGTACLDALFPMTIVLAFYYWCSGGVRVFSWCLRIFARRAS